jgi:hypothetical protein
MGRIVNDPPSETEHLLGRLAPQAIADPEKRGAFHEMAAADSTYQRGFILAKYGQ